MGLPEVYTFEDALSNLDDVARSWNTSGSLQVLKRCVRQARDEIVAAHDPSWLLKRGSVILQAAQTDGTIEYDHTGGATCERQLTLTDDLWPTWAVDASVRIDEVVYDVQEVKSTTVLQLDSVLNPGADIASGTSYTLYPRYYVLPSDFMAMVSVAEKSAWRLGDYIPFSEMFALDQYDTETGDPRRYTIGPVQDQLGRLGLFLFPPSDTTEPITFLYKRKLRNLRYSGRATREYTGTVQVTVDTTTLAGTGTDFEFGPTISPMAGAIVRISYNTTRPTGLDGLNPYQEQRVIASVSNATTLTMDAQPATHILTDRAYMISDPIDIDSSFWLAFLRCCEKHYAIARNLKNKREAVAAYEDALRVAKRASQPMRGREICSVGSLYATRLTEATSRPEIP